MIIVLARQAVRSARIRTLAFVYVFTAYSFIQPVGYRRTYPTAEDRLAFARSFGNNVGLRLLYGPPHNIVATSGYCAWRVGGVLAIASAAFGLLAAVGAFRADEDSGRMDIVLAGVVSRGRANAAALCAIAAGIVLLWLAEFCGLLVGGLPTAGAAYLAVATASVAPVCAAIGTLTSQLAATQRGALGLGTLAVGVLVLARALADTIPAGGWLRWITPLGWAEQLRPFAGARPLVLLLPAAATVLLLAAAGKYAHGRDIGTGVFPSHDSADPRLRLLRSPVLFALRSQRSSLIAWTSAVAVVLLILGVISHGISAADISPDAQAQIAKLGVGSLTTPTGHLAFLFLF